MSTYRKLTTLGLAIVAAGFLATLRSGAQDRTSDESVLVQPPAASSTESGTPTSQPQPIVPPQPATIPPPQEPQLQQPPTVPPQTNGGVRRQPFMRPTEPAPTTPYTSQPQTTAPSNIAEPMPFPGQPGVVVQPTPHISIDTDRDARRMYHQAGEVRLEMMVKNPADGCVYEIPLCIPACCTDEPRVDARCGIFGRGIVEYCWDCGFTAKVKFRHIIGDVRVEYEGD